MNAEAIDNTIPAGGVSPELNSGDNPAATDTADPYPGNQDFDQPYCPELDPNEPTIAEFLHSAREKPPADDDLKQSDVGRDYHDMPAEVGLLSAILADPERAFKEVGKHLNSESFYDKNNREVVLVVLYLRCHDKEVTRAAVLERLHDVDPDTNYDTHLDLVYRVKHNPVAVRAYARRLQKAARIRGGETYCRYGFSEAFCAFLFRLRTSKVICVGEVWYQYEEGVWKQKSRHSFRPRALASIHPYQQQAKRVSAVLDYVESACQVEENILCGAYKRVDGFILINVANGVLEFPLDGDTERLRAHSPDDGFTLQFPASYNPAVQCPHFAVTLEQALPDEEDRLLLQVFAGSVLYPGCEYETALVCFGPGGTGKSTILYDGIRTVLGEALCGSVGLEELCRSASYSLPSLRRKLLNLASELNGTEVEESANFKKLVSGESMTVREIYGKPSDMVSPCKLAFLSNNMPRFRAGSDAEVRRLRILHFNQKPAVQDVDLKAQIRAESSGVLLWMLGGLHWLVCQREIPRGGAAAREVLDSFRHGNDPVDSFLRERCVFDPRAELPKDDLTDAFNDWCENKGQTSDPLKLKSYFYRSLHQRHGNVIKERRMAGKYRPRHIFGIRLKEDEE